MPCRTLKYYGVKLMQKALASDFDNTLFFMFQEETYRPGDREAIRAFQAQGGLFGISTGRSLTGVRQATGDNVAYDFYILANGSLVLDKHLRTLQKKVVPMSLVRSLYDRYGKLENSVIQAGDTVYTFGPADNPMQTHIDDFEELDGKDIYGISFYTGSEDRAKEMAGDAQQHYGRTIEAYANTVVLDIVGAGCSKGQALETVRQALALERVGAIGDSYNDISMLESADISFTFSYAPQPVQASAGHIVGSVREALTLL